MMLVGFVAPYLLDATTRFAEATAGLPGVDLALITCEPADRLPEQLRHRLAAHWRIDDPLDTTQIAGGVKVWLDVAPPAPDSPALLEEFLTGEEGSYDSVMTDGQVIWDSVSRYLPTPLEVLRNPWIQWAVLMPRDIGGPEYEAIRAIAPTA